MVRHHGPDDQDDSCRDNHSNESAPGHPNLLHLSTQAAEFSVIFLDWKRSNEIKIMASGGILPFVSICYSKAKMLHKFCRCVLCTHVTEILALGMVRLDCSHFSVANSICNQLSYLQPVFCPRAEAGEAEKLKWGWFLFYVEDNRYWKAKHFRTNILFFHQMNSLLLIFYFWPKRQDLLPSTREWFERFENFWKNVDWQYIRWWWKRWCQQW